MFESGWRTAPVAALPITTVAPGVRVTGPVAEFTVAGNLIEMFAHLSVANDLEWHRSVNVPTIRIDGMTVAGD